MIAQLTYLVNYFCFWVRDVLAKAAFNLLLSIHYFALRPGYRPKTALPSFALDTKPPKLALTAILNFAND